MSGIFGLWRLDGPLEPGEPERLAGSPSPPGLEAAVLREGEVGLGVHPRGRPGKPALVRAAGGEAGVLLVAVLRLDNRDDLIRVLGVEGSGDPDDVALLAAAWRRWGDRCPERLLGDFAFAVWDPDARRLWCARDHFGVKPLYYAHRPGRLFAFASSIRALLGLPDVPDDIDEAEIARHLRLPVGGDLSMTYYRAVRRLEPAHVVTVSTEGLEKRRYWRLDAARETRLGSDRAYAEAFREAFQTAVTCRLPDGGPVASMLSGGLDSSAIACAAARSPGSGTVHGLSAVYPDVPESDEREWIEAVLGAVDVVPHAFAADRVSPIADLPAIDRAVGGASYGTNLYLNWRLFGIAAAAGVEVVLDGFDGDATVSHGKAYLAELAIRGRWLTLARVSIPYFGRREGSPLADYLRLVRFGLQRRCAAAKRGREGGSAASIPDPGVLARRLAVREDFVRGFADRFVRPEPHPIDEREAHRKALEAETLLEGLGWIEACGSAQGVEVRFPFFDVRLVELCLSLPPDQKIRDGWSRSILHRGTEGILPPRLQWRASKANLHFGWAHAMRAHARDEVRRLLGDPAGGADRFLDLVRLRSLHERFMEGSATQGEEATLWRGVSLAVWLDVEARAGQGQA